ncbi:hypothetical protein V3C99_003245 [Haemonchus contortus]
MFQFSEACGVFKNSSFENIAACFCSDDDCNGEQTKTFIDNSIRLPTPLPDTTSWSFVPISNKTKEVLQCFRKNMYPPGASPVKESKADESSNLMEWIAICVAVVMVLCCIAPVAYYYVAETRRARQRKAQEAAQQSKTSGSISSPAASQATQLSKTSKGTVSSSLASQATQLSKTSKASFTSPAASLSSSMKKSMSEPAPRKKNG